MPGSVSHKDIHSDSITLRGMSWSPAYSLKPLILAELLWLTVTRLRSMSAALCVIMRVLQKNVNAPTFDVRYGLAIGSRLYGTGR